MLNSTGTLCNKIKVIADINNVYILSLSYFHVLELCFARAASLLVFEMCMYVQNSKLQAIASALSRAPESGRAQLLLSK